MTEPVGGQPVEDQPVARETGQPADEPRAPAGAPQAPAAGERTSGPTGHPAVDAAVARLSEQADLPPSEQVAGYEAAQRALHQTLASIDQT